MSSRPVVLSPSRPEWTTLFELEAKTISGLLGDTLIEIHHVGSTAVPNLVAKPIVDIMPLVASLSLVDHLRQSFEERGYIWKGEYGIERRRYIVRDRVDQLEHVSHIHIFEPDHFEVARHLAFRDFLLTNPAVAEEYGELKTSLAVRFREQRQRYQEEKGRFIEEMLRRTMGPKYVNQHGEKS